MYVCVYVELCIYILYVYISRSPPRPSFQDLHGLAAEEVRREEEQQARLEAGASEVWYCRGLNMAVTLDGSMSCGCPYSKSPSICMGLWGSEA